MSSFHFCQCKNRKWIAEDRGLLVARHLGNGGLVGDTVVVLTDIPETNSQNLLGSQTGWERRVQFALIDAVRNAGLHALTLKLDLLGNDLIQIMSWERPRGLVVMRPSMHRSVSPTSRMSGVAACLAFPSGIDHQRRWAHELSSRADALGLKEVQRGELGNCLGRPRRKSVTCSDALEKRIYKDQDFQVKGMGGLVFTKRT